MAPRPWFKPKRYGYGAIPVTWEGWLVTLGVLAFDVGLTAWLIVVPQISGARPAFTTVLIWAALVFGATFGLAQITRLKTDGAWRWRWGGKE